MRNILNKPKMSVDYKSEGFMDMQQQRRALTMPRSEVPLVGASPNSGL